MEFIKNQNWVRVENGIATVGLNNVAQKELGEIVYVELPKIGAKVKADEMVVVLESTKAAIDVYSPISGEISAVNLALTKNPELVNQAPEKEGWLYQIKID